jgi:DNA (cytosine-5)-methyltransferase 1
VGENVRGLTNWNGGMVFDEVQADLEAEGYEVLPFLLPACAVNAPHRRDRIWFVAKNTNENGWRSEQRKEESSLGQFGNISAGDNERIQANYDKIGNASDTNSNGLNECDGNNEINASEGRLNALCDINQGNGNRNVANTNSGGTQSEQNLRQKVSGKKRIDSNGTQSDASNTTNIGRTNALENGQMERERSWQSNQRNTWDTFPSVTPICIGDDGLSNRLDNITFPKWRNESIKAGGNAIVPQVAYQIFKAIEEYERITDTTPNN